MNAAPRDHLVNMYSRYVRGKSRNGRLVSSIPPGRANGSTNVAKNTTYPVMLRLGAAAILVAVLLLVSGRVPAQGWSSRGESPHGTRPVPHRDSTAPTKRNAIRTSRPDSTVKDTLTSAQKDSIVHARADSAAFVDSLRRNLDHVWAGSPFGPPRLIRADMFVGEVTEIDLKRGIAITRKTIAGTPVGMAEVDSIPRYIRRSIEDDLHASLLQTRQKSIADQAKTREDAPTLEMQYDIPYLPPLAKSIIGEGPSTLRISGHGKVTIGGKSTYRTGDTISEEEQQSRFPTLTMKQELAFKINGTIGDKVHVQIDQDTRRQSDLENNIQIRYQGAEDEIIKEVELGNTNLSLTGSQFISGGRQQQGLFGIKAKAQLGDLELDVIASQQKSSAQKKTFRGGATETTMQIRDVDYVREKFYFIDGSYRTQYGKALEKLRDPKHQPNLKEISIDMATATVPKWARLVSNIEVYEQDNQDTPGAQLGYEIFATLVDSNGNDIVHEPYSPAELAEDGTPQIWFSRMDPGEYTFYPTLGYIEFEMPRSSKAIGVVITYTNAGGAKQVFPQAVGTDSTLILKMIKYGISRPSDPTWRYEWRNVYDLGARGLTADEFSLEIVDATITSRPDKHYTSDSTFMQKLKLDMGDANLLGQPDGLVDLNRAKVNLETGLVYFPFLEPFRDGLLGLTTTDNSGNPRDDYLIKLYDSDDRYAINNESHYLLIAKYKKAASRIQLGFNVLENSEIVKLNGVTLTRDVDYTVSYLTGELQFAVPMVAQITQPGADLSIDYEINPLFQPDQETLVGLRAVYKLGASGQIGGTFMFNSERTSQQRVRIGEEPTKMTLLGSDFSYEFKPFWLTKAIDALPLISTDVISQITLEAEVAKSLPNLNTLGVGYLDDFEGSSRSTPITIFRKSWFPSSVPKKYPTTGFEPTLEEKGKFAWFNNPSELQIMTEDIWPDRTATGEDKYADVMYMWFRPEGETPAAREESWGGIMRSFGTDGTDLQRTQYIEIWLKASNVPFHPGMDKSYSPSGDMGLSGSPKLHIEIGAISEDVITVVGPERFNTPNVNDEDELKNPLYLDEIWWGLRSNGQLNYSGDDYGEDVGLDGCPDAYETGGGGCGTFEDPDAIDPNGDNWSYKWTGLLTAFEWINNTERNRSDSQGLTARPDTEDLNGDSRLNLENRYITYTVPLKADPSDRYWVETKSTGFTLYRIPIKDLDLPSVNSVGTMDDFSFSNIKSMRLWISGVEDDTCWVTLAQMELIGNDWEEIKKTGDKFEVATIGSENSGYIEPPGVQRERDPVYRNLLPEQSLTLQFSDIRPGQTHRAIRDLVSPKDLTNYSRIKMYLHGPTRGLDEHWDHLSAFVRLGLDTTAYYELRIPKIYPGWDERNFIEVHLDSLTNLKLTQKGTVFAGTDTISTDGRMRIVGLQRGSQVSLPSLAAIKVLQIGVTNLTDHHIRSANESKMIQIWFDDLRLNGIRNISGTAIRTQTRIKMADLVSFTANATRKEIGFGTLTDKAGLKSTTENVSLSMSQFRVDKFLPTRWRLSVPVNVSYTYTTGTPRLKQGSDIELIDDADKELSRSKSSNLNASTSFRKTSQSDNPIAALTIDRLNLGLGFSRSQRISPSASSRDSFRSVNYTGKIGYDLTPRRRRVLKPFQFASPVLPEIIRDFKLFYLPTSLRFSSGTSFRQDSTWQLQKIAGRDTTYLRGSRSFSLSESYTTAMQPMTPLKLSYDLSVNRDLDDSYEGEPDIRQILSHATKNIFRKNEINRSHKFRTDLAPRGPWFLGHSYSFSNAYRDNSDPNSTSSVAGESGAKFYTVSSTRAYNVSSLSFKLQDILKRASGDVAPASKSRSRRRRSTKRSTSTGSKSRTASKSKSAAAKSDRSLLQYTAGFLAGYLQNITGRVSFQEQYSGRQIPDSLRPPLLYQVFGFGGDPSLEGASLGLLSNNSFGETFAWNVGSGIKLPLNMQLRGKYSYSTRRTVTSDDTTRSRNIIFPDIAYTWDGLEKYPLIKHVASRSGIQSAFIADKTENWKATGGSPEIMQSRTRNFKFDPLLAWTVVWKPKIRSTYRSTWSRAYTDNVTQVNQVTGAVSMSTIQRTNWSMSMTAGYVILTSRGIPKPWNDEVWRLNGNIDVSLGASYSSAQVVDVGGSTAIPGEDLLTSNSRSWSVKPAMSYQFSKTFSGSANVQVGATKDLISGTTTHTRSLSITGEIRFN
jgi:hypothetical protein